MLVGAEAVCGNRERMLGEETDVAVQARVPLVVDGDIGDGLGEGFGFGAGLFLAQRDPLRPRCALLVQACADAADQRQILARDLGAVDAGIDAVHRLFDGVQQQPVELARGGLGKVCQQSIRAGFAEVANSIRRLVVGARGIGDAFHFRPPVQLHFPVDNLQSVAGGVHLPHQ